MQFGLQYFPLVSPPRSTASYFAESLDLAAEAETLGFTHTRIVEHYFHTYGGASPNPLLFLSALSQRTKSMRLVTGAVLPVFNHPLKLAGEIGMADALSNGRLDVGFARAFLPHEFRAFGISPDQSQARFREGVEQIELLLTTENVTSIGQFHSFEKITSLPRPTQEPRPRFYIAATQTEETFEYAGRNGHYLMAIPIGPLKPLLNVYREAWRKAGHPGNGVVMVAFHMFCHEDGAKAREIARAPFDKYFRSLNECVREWGQGLQSKDYRDYDKQAKTLDSATLESQIASGGAWIGSPSEIVDIIVSVRERIGPFEQASLQVNFGDLDYDRARASLQLFAHEVMPKLA